MSTTLDLQGHSRADRRHNLFSVLDDLDPEKSLQIVTDHDIDVLLHQYQMKRDYRLQWAASGETSEPGDFLVEKRPTRKSDGLYEFDVREMPPMERHKALLDTFDILEPGEGFVLVNDHDPKPLYHELRSTRGDTFDWEYRKQEAQEWKVGIVKTEDSDPTSEDVVASFDVREIPKAERHPTIHHRYGNIPENGTLEIIAPHEPRPLYREFKQQYGKAFTWDVVETEHGYCRVHITKSSADHTENSEESTDLDVTTELDVRNLPPAQRHEQIYDAYADLESGHAFILINDHDPKPLYHQFNAEAGAEFHWEYHQKKPGEFRVLIGKNGSASANSRPADGTHPPF